MVKVTAAILVEHGRVLIARRPTTARLPNLWEFPGGKIEDGETPEACLKRELREEFEIEVAVGEHIGSTVYAYPFGTVELMAYKAKRVSGAFKLNDHSEIAWPSAGEIGDFEFAPADIPFVGMIMDGEIALST